MTTVGSASRQGMLWSAYPRDWAELQEPKSKPLWVAMLRAGHVGWRTRMLDAGCGAGGAAALGRGLGAEVKGLDASEGLIRFAHQRIRFGDFQVGEIEDLPFADGSFNFVLAADSVGYAGDPLRAMTELRRVCSTTGRVAVSVWGSPEQCDQRVIFDALRSCVPCPPPHGPFALSAPCALERLTESAGMRVAGVHEIESHFHYPDVDTAWLAQRSAGWTQTTLQLAEEDDVRAAFLQAIRPYVIESGAVKMKNVYKFVLAVPDLA